MHLAWDVMVGLGTLLFLLALWYWVCWLFRRDMPKSRWFLRVASVAGVRRGGHDGGRLGGQRGRPPAVDRLQPHEGRGRRHRQHRGLDHVRARRLLYIGLGVTTMLILRKMSRRFREPRRRRGGRARTARARRRRLRRRRPEEVTVAMSTAVAVVLFVAVTAYAVLRRRRLRRRVLGPRRRRRRPRRASPRGDRPLDRPGVGGQPRLADLHLRRAVDRLLRGLRLDHPDAVRAAHAGRVRHRAARGRASRSARPCSAPATGGTSAPPSPSSSVLVPYCMGAVAGAIASGRVPAGGDAGDPWTSWVNPTSILGGVLAVVVVAYLAAVYLVWDARRLADRDDGGVLPAPCRRRRRRRRRRRARRDLRAARRRPLPLRRAHHAGAADRDPLGALRRRVARPAGPTSRSRRPPPGHRRRRQHRHRLGRRPVALHPAARASRCPTRPRPRAP